MRFRVTLTAGLYAILFLAHPAFADDIAMDEAREITAHADFINTAGEKVGKALLSEDADGVIISIEASNLPAGMHGFHIHAVGKCEVPDFTSAGSHFNPTGKQHGVNNPEGHHAGDLSNLTVEADGTVDTEISVSGVTLNEGETSLFHPDGTALIIHENADDEVTDPIGNAGARIACAVIEKD